MDVVQTKTGRDVQERPSGNLPLGRLQTTRLAPLGNYFEALDRKKWDDNRTMIAATAVAITPSNQ
jgi:hypothetical protein